ncbi:hypothetical protein RFI_35454 [Reticulomyxa filosa]|uniref:Uncharacterized protein n=1 Tax=Reticulomyxa filosa TaxID=46433 RepID=X6LK61_RETFI|nr:hypothetical protein RFI_35454 [Reticulomyxa filosa]|eukprot:ETO01984.1 hypothetical protein RFI_35454 [Reticulomyxa filosa]
MEVIGSGFLFTMLLVVRYHFLKTTTTTGTAKTQTSFTAQTVKTVDCCKRHYDYLRWTVSEIDYGLTDDLLNAEQYLHLYIMHYIKLIQENWILVPNDHKIKLTKIKEKEDLMILSKVTSKLLENVNISWRANHGVRRVTMCEWPNSVEGLYEMAKITGKKEKKKKRKDIPRVRAIPRWILFFLKKKFVGFAAFYYEIARYKH